MSQLLEPALVVRCRQADQQIVESVVPAVTLELNILMSLTCVSLTLELNILMSLTCVSLTLELTILMSSSCVSLQSVAEYKAKVNKDCQVKLDTDNWLPADW